MFTKYEDWIMASAKTQTVEGQDIKRYRQMEARLYGDLMKVCRRYGSELNIISVLGIIEIVKSELKELDKQGRQLMKKNLPEEDTEHIDTIM